MIVTLCGFLCLSVNVSLSVYLSDHPSVFLVNVVFVQVLVRDTPYQPIKDSNVHLEQLLRTCVQFLSAQPIKV